MTELEKKLKTLLESQSIDGDFDIDSVSKELGLDEQGKQLLRKACQNIDDIDEKAKDLAKEKVEKGWSAKQWIVNRLWKKMGDMKAEDKAEVINKIGSRMQEEVSTEVEQISKEED